MQNNKSVHIYTSKYTKEAESLFHIHQYFELEIITEGEGTNGLKTFNYPLKKGSAYIIAPPICHKIVLSPNTKVITVFFRNLAIKHSSLLKQLKLNFNYKNLTVQELSKVLNWAEQISEMRDCNDNYTEETC